MKTTKSIAANDCVQPIRAKHVRLTLMLGMKVIMDFDSEVAQNGDEQNQSTFPCLEPSGYFKTIS